MSCFKSCRTFKKTIVITPSVTRMAQPVTQTTVPETITTPEIQADSEKKDENRRETTNNNVEQKRRSGIIPLPSNFDENADDTLPKYPKTKE